MHNKVRYALYVVATICCTVLLLLIAHQILISRKSADLPANSLHFVVITPELDGKNDSFTQTLSKLEDAYGLQIELHSFATVAEQEQMLRIISKTGIDGVLLWPISADDEDYEEELLACRQRKLPVVIIDRDVSPDLRDSFIGSGISSDLLVLNQKQREMGQNEILAVGDRFGSGSSQVVEILLFSRTAQPGFDVHTIQNMKLQHLALEPPSEFQPYDYLRLEGENARSLQLKYALIGLFSQTNSCGLFFSMDESLSSSVISAKSSMPLSMQGKVHLLCYGDRSDNLEYLKRGMIDGIVASKPAYSAYIGLRYLRDICHGLWIPQTMDSGSDYITPENLNENQ